MKNEKRLQKLNTNKWVLLIVTHASKVHETFLLCLTVLYLSKRDIAKWMKLKITFRLSILKQIAHMDKSLLKKCADGEQVQNVQQKHNHFYTTII